MRHCYDSQPIIDLGGFVPKKTPLLSLLLLLAAYLLASCGGSGTEEPASPPEADQVSDTGASGADDSDVEDSDEGLTEESDAENEEGQESDVVGSEESVSADSEERIAALGEVQETWLDFEAPDFLECWLDNLVAATGVSYSDVRDPQTWDDELWDTSVEIWFGDECMSFVTVEQADEMYATLEAAQEIAALSDVDQLLINSVQSYDWDNLPWVSADIESIDVPAGTEFSVILTLENFTESPIFAVACDPTSAGDFFAGTQLGQEQCFPPPLATFDDEGVAVITATSTGEGACWGVGGIAPGGEIGFICLPFGDLDGYSSADCADNELGDGFLVQLSDGAYWCNYGEVSHPIAAVE